MNPSFAGTGQAPTNQPREERVQEVLSQAREQLEGALKTAIEMRIVLRGPLPPSDGAATPNVPGLSALAMDVRRLANMLLTSLGELHGML